MQLWFTLIKSAATTCAKHSMGLVMYYAAFIIFLPFKCSDASASDFTGRYTSRVSVCQIKIPSCQKDF